MSDPFFRAFALMIALNAVAFVAGLIVGRFKERDRITEWLWNRTPAQIHLGTIAQIERGEHRRGLDREQM